MLVLSPFFSFFLYCVLHEAADEASVAPCALQFYRGAVRAVRVVVKGAIEDSSISGIRRSFKF
jgi:hypothetical protein